MAAWNLLVIDTCGETGTVALVQTDGAVSNVSSATLPGRTASEMLIATIRNLTVERKMPLQTLNGVAVVNGPGSFTGVRVGVSAAKGLCEALSLPLIAISRLAVLAQAAEVSESSHIQAVLDAGRGEFYAGLYSGQNRLREALVSREELLTGTLQEGDLPTVTVVCEPGVAELLRPLSPQVLAAPTAESALPLVLRTVQERRFADVATLDANYLRRTDAEIFAKHAVKNPSAARAGR